MYERYKKEIESKQGIPVEIIDILKVDESKGETSRELAKRLEIHYGSSYDDIEIEIINERGLEKCIVYRFTFNKNKKSFKSNISCYQD